jgi:uncharacterized damage-inducible protein DinB
LTASGTEPARNRNLQATTPIAEREVLLARLEGQRRHILGDLEGLGEDDLRRGVLPSHWSCLGLLGHLTNDVERFWFRCVVAGERDAIEETMSDNNAWEVAPDCRSDDILAAYRGEIAKSNAVIASSSLDAAPAWWPEELFGSWRLETVREIVLHVIIDTATHAGQLDAVRELIDGKQWVVLT